MSEQANDNDLPRSETSTPVAVERRPSNGRWTQRQIGGLILILLGVIFFLNNLGVFWWWDWDTTWPLIIMGIGLILLLNSTRGKAER